MDFSSTRPFGPGKENLSAAGEDDKFLGLCPTLVATRGKIYDTRQRKILPIHQKAK
jgi:hypothetical protein